MTTAEAEVLDETWPFDLCGLQVHGFTAELAAARIASAIGARSMRRACLVSAQSINRAAMHRKFRISLQRYDFRIPTGAAMKLAAPFLNTPGMPGVSVESLLDAMCKQCAVTGHRIYVIGGEAGDSTVIGQRIANQYPGVVVAGSSALSPIPPDADELVTRVRESKPDLIIVGAELAAQEYFVGLLGDEFNGASVVCLGDVFDRLSGRRLSAPGIVNRIHLGWAWRLLDAPLRLVYSTLTERAVFLARVIGYRYRAVRGLYDGSSTGDRPVQTALDNDVTPGSDTTVSAAQHESPSSPNAQRAVLWAAGLPSEPALAQFGLPAGLFPLGDVRFVEAAIENIARAGIKQIDLVLSVSPERIHRRVGDGRRWGCNISVHLVPDPGKQYHLLNSIMSESVAPVLLAHAARIPLRANLSGLSAASWWTDPNVEKVARWSGWAVVNEGQAKALANCEDESSIAGAVLALGDEVVISDLVSAETGANLLAAQAVVLKHLRPSSRLHAAGERVSVGSGSSVSPSALLTPPALVGRYSYVGRDVSLGPNVVVGDHVVIEAEARLSNTVVLSNTYIAADLDLSNAIVCGSRILDVSLGTVLQFAPEEMLISTLRKEPTGSGSNFIGRLMALCMLLLCSPMLLIALLRNLKRFGRLDWPTREGVARDPSGAQPFVGLPFRDPFGGSRYTIDSRGFIPWLARLLPGLLDIAQGRLAWFGPQARVSEELTGLSEDWQEILLSRPAALICGSFTLVDDRSSEFHRAMADVYQVVTPGIGPKLSLLKAWISDAVPSQG